MASWRLSFRRHICSSQRLPSKAPIVPGVQADSSASPPLTSANALVRAFVQAAAPPSLICHRVGYLGLIVTL